MKPRDVLLVLSVTFLFLAIVVGAYVTVAGFGDACGSSLPSDWPGCLGGVIPPLQLAPVMEYLHRLMAAFSTLFLLLTTLVFWRGNDVGRATKRILFASCILLVAQVLLGGVVIAQAEEAVLVAAHQGLAVLTFGFAVAAYAYSKGP
jgi:heme A synthase